MNNHFVRVATVADAAPCAAIFAHYARHTAATLQAEPLSPEYFVPLIQHAIFVVATADNAVCGYAYADVLRGRCGYRQTMEVSIYVEESKIGGGIGTKLMQTLLAALQQQQMRAAVAFITMPNPSSIKLHEKFGFVFCGAMPGVGWKFQRAYDVGIWVNNLV